MNMTQHKPPLVIGATGGSGTRAFVRVIRHAGFFMGANLGEDEDVSVFGDWLRESILPYSLRNQTPLSDQQLAEMTKQFHDRVKSYRSTMPDPDQNWGWKNPRSIYMLPFMHSQYPGMKFIHVVRDGRDMAFSENQKQLKLFGAAFLSQEQRAMPKPARSIALWSHVNLTAAKYGETEMSDGYLRVRFEDLCLDTEATVRRIFAFLQASEAGVAPAMGEVAQPSSIGRWRQQTFERLYDVLQAGKTALEYFGYWDDAVWSDLVKQRGESTVDKSL
jgi:hypothetical protein